MNDGRSAIVYHSHLFKQFQFSSECLYGIMMMMMGICFRIARETIIKRDIEDWVCCTRPQWMSTTMTGLKGMFTCGPGAIPILTIKLFYCWKCQMELKCVCIGEMAKDTVYVRFSFISRFIFREKSTIRTESPKFRKSQRPLLLRFLHYSYGYMN